MNLIAKLLPPSNIILDLNVSSKKRIFEQVGLLFENHQGIARSQVFDSLFTREKQGSTAFGHGIAIPHGRMRGLKDAVAAFIRMQKPVPFEAPDGKPVSLIFVLLSPEHANNLHLQILGELAQLFSSDDVREQLAVSQDISEIHRLLIGEETYAANQHPPGL